MKAVIEKKFKTIGFLDSDRLISELQSCDTISDKLDYLKSIKKRYFDKFDSVIDNFSTDEQNYYYEDNNRTQFWESVFGNYSLITPLKIQEPVFERFFKNGLNNPEFTYWFLKYNSERAFKLHINNKEFKSKINSDLKTTFIESELKQLNDFETKAKDLLLNKELDIYKPHSNNYKYSKELTLLRVLDGNYYKENTIIAVSNFSDEVQAYYKYKLLKPYLSSKLNNLSSKILALFKFIEYLHSNIKNFNQYSGLIIELEQLDKERNQLKPRTNYKDKQQYDKVQAELESKFKTLQENTANQIKAKAKELNVCSFDNEPNYQFNEVETEIRQLKKSLSDKDLPEIFKHKSKYLEYRSQTHKTFLSLQFFFDELDKVAKSLFDYFKDTTENEFEPFETKAIEVNSITEAAQRFNKQGQTKFVIPNNIGQTQSRIQEKLADFNFFQIEVITDLEFNGKIDKDVKQRNNDSILTPENWEQHKETFFNQRMVTYKDCYTLSEKIKLELLSLEKLPINGTDYQILKDRYKDYLGQNDSLPLEQSKVKSFELTDETKRQLDRLSELAFKITLDKTEQFIKRIKNELEQVNTINEKKNICLKHIRNCEQTIASVEIFNLDIPEPTYKNCVVQTIDWLKIELKYLNDLNDLPAQSSNATNSETIEDRHAKNIKKPKHEQETPKTFEELFYNPTNAEPCLKILNELQPPFIDAMNNYIGKSKGIFPLWVGVLKNHKPEPLIKHFNNTIYKDLLNSKVKGLNLSNDASEFRKHYKRLENDNIELDIKAILSQFSQNGKLGK